MCNFSSFGLVLNIYFNSKDIMPGPHLGFPYTSSHQSPGGCFLPCQSHKASPTQQVPSNLQRPLQPSNPTWGREYSWVLPSAFTC